MEFQQNSATTAVSGVAVSSDTPKISSPVYRRTMTPDKRSSASVHCRICHEDGGIEELIDPCECSGTLGLIHTTCLEKWLSTSNTDRCEICKYSFMIERKKKPLSQSFRQWWRSRNIFGPQGIAGDVMCLIVLTPLCIAATYLCAIGASAYTRLGFWEGTGLAVLCCMLVATYCLWLVVTVRFHFKSWQQWHRKNRDVKLMVKHKSDGLSHRESQIKGVWDVGQDSNNNNAVHSNRLTTWFFAHFSSHTNQQNGSKVFEESDAGSAGKWRGEAGLLSTPPNGQFPQQNVGPVKFEVPQVPVIFVLGGPGSGKVTHCDNLMQEKKGITHINMMDLLQQYALGNDMQDFGQLSSKTVAEVLMLEIKMSPGSKVFLVSGYPRNMRDVVEYAEKIKIVNGVVLVSWRQEILERQIDFGAQLGQVVIELARMELYNFYRNVMPVAEYFDQSGMLVEVNGERSPSEVYIDFREAVFKILGLTSGDVREKNVPQSLEAEVEVERRKESIPKSPPPKKEEVVAEVVQMPITVNVKPMKTANKPRKGLPAFIWIIGGPGSNKENLCTQAVRNMPGWVHVSIGGLLRTMASSNTIVNDAIVSGEMVPQDIVVQVVEQQIMLNRDTDGIIIDGYPRESNQMREFENKFGQQPPLVLLDCSKLQLGRGRLDDSVSAFRKRLELFREVSLPMLKTLDNENRLSIIEGDTDVPSVQQEFAAALYQLMTQTRRREEGPEKFEMIENESNANLNSMIPNNGHAVIISNGVSKQMMDGKSNVEKAPTATKNMNGISIHGAARIANGLKNNARQAQKNGPAHVQNGIANGAANMLQNGVAHLANGIAVNSNKVAPAVQNYLPNNTKDAVRKMYNEVEGYQQNLHM